ncbi:MAG: lipid-A-disaccharide synthase N-terminal domain-containing protein [Muribaculaceae bacterium]|nr:lipid-A-disaccharide synthase N-terminal domain-containing protein [Muribaculaceae bacterium]
MPSWLIYSIGFSAQIFFSARILIQWIMSERARKVLSPSIFWILSICGSYILCIYGCLRHDFAIVLGQFLSYYVYLWNLKAKGIWKKLNTIVQGLLLLTPIAAILYGMTDTRQLIDSFFANEDVPLWLLIYGSAGQIIFTLRFIYQYLYSRREGESELPAGFWWLSLTGSLAIVSYGIFRQDPVLIVGQSFGLVAYIRNLWIGYRQKIK